jgi:hypothetical protein
MRDRYIFVAAFTALVGGVRLAVDLPEFWDEETLIAYLISIPCLTTLAFLVKDALTTAKDTEHKKECTHLMEMVVNG